MRVGTGMALKRASATIQKALRGVDVPFIVQHGSDDAVVSLEGSKRLFESAEAADKTFQVFPGTPLLVN